MIICGHSDGIIERFVAISTDGHCPSNGLLNSLLTFDRFEHFEAAHQSLIDRHHCTRIVKFATIIGRTENCDELPLGKKLVAILNDLVCANNEIHVVLLQETAHNVRPKNE